MKEICRTQQPRRFGASALCLVVLVLLVAAPAFSQSEPGHRPFYRPAKHRVLLLHSYHPNFTWSQAVSRGVLSVLDQRKEQVDLVLEFMDSKRIDNPEYFETLREMYLMKYSGLELDAIICSDNNALDFLVKYGEQIFPNVPIVFCGVNDLNYDRIANRKITGVVEELAIDATVRQAVRFHPGAKNLTVIIDETVTGRALRRKAEEVLDAYRPKMQTNYISTVSVKELERAVSQLPEDTIIFLFVFNRDRLGQVLGHEESLRLIAESTDRPIYSFWEFYLGNGIVGGKLISGYQQGRSAGEMALSIVHGQSVDQMPVLGDSPNRWMFDYRQLQKHDIQEEHLPAGAVVRGKSVSFYERYGYYIWVIAAAVAALVALNLAMIANILRRRRAERALAESERHLRGIFESAENVAFVEARRKGDGYVITDFSPGAEHIFGYTKEEILGDSPRKLVDESQMDHDQLVQELVAADGVVQLEVSCKRKNGETFPGLFSGGLVGREYGLDLAIAFVVDITQRKAFEREMRIQRDFAQRLIDTAQTIVVLLDSDFRIVRFNRFGEQVTGFKQEEIVGEDFRRLFLSGAAEIPLQRIVEGEQLERVEFAMSGKADQELVIRWYFSRLQAGEDEPVHILAVGADITDLRAKEEQLRQAAKMEAVGRLAGGVAHDFNNQLTVVAGYCDLLLRSMDEDDPNRDAIEQIREAARRSAKLTSQLLSFSRKQVLKPEANDLNAVLQGMSDLLHRVMGEDIQLVFELEDDLPNVHVDRAQFEEAVMNLVVNARDAMPEGGTLTLKTSEVSPPPEVLAAGASPHPYVRLTVRDTGVGMNESMLQKIFEPFFTTKDVGEGTGLGLPMVYGFVKQSGGHLDVESAPGEGSSFYMLLPSVEQSKGMLSAAPEQEKVESGGSEKLLVAEDDPAVRNILVRSLQREGYDVLVAADAEEALGLAREHVDTLDMLITDMIMPKKTGAELAEEVRRLKPNIKTLYISGYPQKALEKRNIEERKERLLRKPFSPDQLTAVVRTILDESAGRFRSSADSEQNARKQ
ncbi:MAG: ABC transporter substrate binding protein [Phycisphaerae bacterium]